VRVGRDQEVMGLSDHDQEVMGLSDRDKEVMGLSDRDQEVMGLSDRCQAPDTAPCSSHPCLHSGQCVDGWNRYICDCTMTGYIGTVCQHGTSHRPTASATSHANK